ncbi:hypothetical protein [Nocardia phage KYD2]|nr:hypothetical protein [Nocardia phage KYD2]
MIDLDSGLELTEHEHAMSFMLTGAPTLPPNWSGGKAWIPTNAKVLLRWKPGQAPKVARVDMSGTCTLKDGTAGRASNSNYWHPNHFRLGWPDNTPEYVQRVADNALTAFLDGWKP